MSQFNPFYYYYNTEHASKALERQLEQKRREGERQLCRPPELPRLRGAFAGLPAVAATPAVVKAVLCTLDRAGEAKRQNRYFTPKMVRQACFLVAQGCQDELVQQQQQQQQQQQDGDGGGGGGGGGAGGRFVQLVQDHDLVGKLRSVLASPHEDLKADDIRQLVNYTIETSGADK